ASATFSNPSSSDTTVSFPQTGSYVLQYSASNLAGGATSQMTVVVNPVNDPSLALRLKLNESSGTTATDSSGNNNTGTIVGSVTWQSSNGVFGGAAGISGGINNYINVPDSSLLDNTGAFTLAYWFRTGTPNVS